MTMSVIIMRSSMLRLLFSLKFDVVCLVMGVGMCIRFTFFFAFILGVILFLFTYLHVTIDFLCTIDETLYLCITTIIRLGSFFVAFCSVYFICVFFNWKMFHEKTFKLIVYREREREREKWTAVKIHTRWAWMRDSNESMVSIVKNVEKKKQENKLTHSDRHQIGIFSFSKLKQWRK